MLPRIDPREALQHIGPQGLPRWNRTAVEGKSKRLNPHMEAKARLRHELRAGKSAAPFSHSHKVVKPLFIPDAEALKVLVFVLEEQLWINAEAEMLGSTRELFPDANIILVTDTPVAPEEAGADQMITTKDLSAAFILFLIEQLSPDHVVFGDAGEFKASARMVAAKTQRSAVFNVVSQRDQKVTYTLNGGRMEVTTQAPFLICLPRKTCAAYAGEMCFGAVPIALSEPAAITPTSPFKDCGLLAVDAKNLSLKEAELVISAGAGLAAWTEFFKLANQINAAVAGSRVVCDQESLPRSRQVGASGELIEARCYLALGISGAPQHLQGIQRCKYVIAINTDPYAAIMKRADLAITGDVNAILPELSRLLEEIHTP